MDMYVKRMFYLRFEIHIDLYLEEARLRVKYYYGAVLLIQSET